MKVDLPRRIAAEALGTALLVAAVVGSGIMAETLTKDQAMALMANTIPTVFALVVLITIFGPVSGAHFNPAVSLVFALRRELTWRDFAAYVPAQVLGGVAGTLLAHAMFGQALLQVSGTHRLAASLALSEVVATFALVAAILGTLRANPAAIPAIVGAVIGSAYWFTASTSFANPAVTIARAFTDTFAGIAPGGVPVFVAAQIVGALLAMAAMGWILGGRRS